MNGKALNVLLLLALGLVAVALTIFALGPQVSTESADPPTAAAPPKQPDAAPPPEIRTEETLRGGESLESTPTEPRSVLGEITGPSVRGRLEALDGYPLPTAATVMAKFPFPGSEKTFSAAANPDGSFAVAVSEHLAGGWIHVESDFHFAEPVSVQRNEDGSFPEIAIGLHTGGKIEGRALLPDGKAAVGAKISLALPLDPWQMQMGGSEQLKPRETTADAEGRFALKAVPAGKNRMLRARLVGFGPATAKALHVDRLETRRVELRLAVEAAVSGRVFSEKQEPLAGAKVVAVPWKGMGGLLEEAQLLKETEKENAATTDAKGDFRIGSLPSGKFKLFASKPGLQGGIGETVDLEEGKERSGVVLALKAGLSVRGKVVDRKGEPVAGAEVEAKLDFFSGEVKNVRFGADEDSGGKATTAGDGSFDLPGLGRGPYELVATLEGKGRGSRSRVRGGAEGVEIQLLPYGTVAGKVTAAGIGVPISKFKVSAVEIKQGFMPVTVKSEDFQSKDGAFRLEGIPPGSLTVLAAAEGFAPLRKKAEVRAGEETEPLDFALYPESAIRGTVVEKGNGKPVQGARVALAGEGMFAWIQERMDPAASQARSDREGRFELRGLGAGKHTLRVSHADYAPTTAGPFELGHGETEEGARVEISAGGGIDGFFYREDGGPNAGAMIMAMGMGGSSFQNAHTDEKGYFRIEKGLAPGQYQVMGMGSFGDSTEEEEIGTEFLQGMKVAMAAVEEGKIVRVSLGEKREGGCLVRGRVVAGGAPVSGAIVSMVPRADARTEGVLDLKFASTDSQGGFSIENVPPGRQRFTVQRSASAGGSVEIEAEIPESGEHFVELRLPGGAIRGRVVDARTGEPVPHLFVSLSPEKESGSAAWSGGGFAQVSTDEEGRFRIADLKPGDYLVSAPGGLFFGGENRGYGRATRRVALAAEQTLEGVDFALRPGGRVEGQALSLGKPVAQASIFLKDASGKILNPLSDVLTDAEGRFSYEGVAPGSYTVLAKASGLAPGSVEGVAVEEGAATEVQLHLAPGTELVVQLLGEGGAALEGASVQVFDEAGKPVLALSGISDMMKVWSEGTKPGHYPFGTVPPGKYRVVASAPGYKSLDTTVQIAAQPSQTLTLQAEKLP